MSLLLSAQNLPVSNAKNKPYYKIEHCSQNTTYMPPEKQAPSLLVTEIPKNH
jgi:hypothetical protein